MVRKKLKKTKRDKKKTNIHIMYVTNSKVKIETKERSIMSYLYYYYFCTYVNT